MSNVAISIKNVSKYYKLYNSPKDRLKEALNFSGKIYHKKFYATQNLSLEIKKGEILGIVGKNGSGKSTLLKLITGVLHPDEGSVQVNGKISALLELGSGFNPEFTGLQNIYFYGTILGFSKTEMDEKLDDIIAFADIGDFLYQPIKTYSSGMKSRLGFAVAVHIDPEILILDEVLAVGDILFKRKCYTKMEEFFKGGKTIIYVSHDANSIRELCTKAIFLYEGNIILDSSPKIVTQLYEKFLFSKNKDSILDEIKEIKQKKKKDPLKKEKQSITTNKIIKNNQYIIDFSIQSITINTDFFEFSNVEIKTIKGTLVNNLVRDKYKLCFDAKANIHCQNVYFGAQLKALNGIIISGCNSKELLQQTIPIIKKNDTFHIEIEFDNYLLAGTYVFMVFARDNHEIAILENSYIFKVQDPGYKQAGYITLNQKIFIQNKKVDNSV